MLEEYLKSQESGLPGSCEPPYSWEPNLGPLEKQVLLTTGPSLQPLIQYILVFQGIVLKIKTLKASAIPCINLYQI